MTLLRVFEPANKKRERKKNFKNARGKQFWFFYFLSVNKWIYFFLLHFFCYFYIFIYIFLHFLWLFLRGKCTLGKRRMHRERRSETNYAADAVEVCLKFSVSDSTRPDGSRLRQTLTRWRHEKSSKPQKSANFLTNFLFTNTKLLQLHLDAFSSQLFCQSFSYFIFVGLGGGEC